MFFAELSPPQQHPRAHMYPKLSFHDIRYLREVICRAAACLLRQPRAILGRLGILIFHHFPHGAKNDDLANY